MQAISSWVQQLGFLILFAGLIEVLLPNTSVRKVARLVIGLAIILAIIDPLVSLVANPGWIDSLFADAFFVDGEPYVRAGAEIAQSAQHRAESVWVMSMGKEVAVVLTLIEGIHDAAVAIDGGEEPQRWRVDVTLWGSETLHLDPHWRQQREIEVDRLVRKLMDPLSVDDVRVSWSSAVGDW